MDSMGADEKRREESEQGAMQTPTNRALEPQMV
jgi:hypothetical protein